MTIFEAYNHTKKMLEKAGIEDYVFEAKQILRHITGYTAAQILTNYQQPLTPFQENNLTALLRQREIRYPLQYIFGEWDFYGGSFSVGPGVLIPRADTETLIDTVLPFLKDRKAPRILDLCAGSGCIGITLAREIPKAEVRMLEKYEEAGRYAKENILRNGTENAVVVTGDIFSGDEADGPYDLIVSNPPYIAPHEKDLLSPETAFEPETALAGGEDGLSFYRAILKNYAGGLKDGGMLAFEVGVNGASAVEELFRQAGAQRIGKEHDLNGIERVVYGIF